MCRSTNSVSEERIVSITIVFDLFLLVHHNLIFRCPHNFSRTGFIAYSQDQFFAWSAYDGPFRHGGGRIVIDARLYAILSVAFQYIVLSGTDCVWSTAVSNAVSKVGHPASKERSQVWHGGNYILFTREEWISTCLVLEEIISVFFPYPNVELDCSPKHKQCWISVSICDHSDLSHS